jgi:GTP-binding protein HflX
MKNERPERAVLVGVSRKSDPETKIDDYLDELEFLATSAGAEVVGRFKQRLERPNPKTYVGSGKLQQIEQFIRQNKVDVVIFDDELSPAQQARLEDILQVKIVDRSRLILDIFARRARTAIAKAQVELAQYQYLLPRLRGRWTHLERQRGGIGLRGPGEKELETDRRIIRNRIAKLKRDLEKYKNQMQVQRKNRGKLVRVTFVGYTNVGKSTLMNVLTKAGVYAEDKAFATLDTIVRRVNIGNLPFLLSDTVGFIRKLPPHLVESFQSTLDEVKDADVLLHVVDISHPDFEEHIRTVEKTLHDIGAADKPQILVFNKIDKYKYEEKDPYDLTPINKKNYTLEDWERTWMARVGERVVFVSATKRIGIERLRKILYKVVRQIHVQRYPYDDFLYPDEYM